MVSVIVITCNFALVEDNLMDMMVVKTVLDSSSVVVVRVGPSVVELGSLVGTCVAFFHIHMVYE